MNFYFTFQRIGKFFKLSNRNIFETVDNSNKNVPIYYNKDK